MAKQSNASRRYHDRVASRYDAMYDDPYWEFHDRVTWNHLKPFLPQDPAAPVLDLGCGTGKWGLRLLKAGHPTTFADHSPNMLVEVRARLDQWAAQSDLAARAARATLIEADAVDLRALPAEHFALAVAMGDVVSICNDAGRCLSELRRVLQPGGAVVFTVDNQLAALDHFVEKGRLDELADFVQTGRTQWLTNDREERFPLQMFSPRRVETQLQKSGLHYISHIGKTIIPARRNKKLFDDEAAIRRLVELETQLARDPAAAARASHLQFAARRPAEEAGPS